MFFERADDPTPQEIELRAAEIRDGWTPKERAKRWCGGPDSWLPPLWPGVEDNEPERGWN